MSIVTGTVTVRCYGSSVRGSRTTGVALLAATCLVVSGCEAGGLGGDARVSTDTATTAAPTIDVPRLDGAGRYANADLRGRPTVINFWASWCGPCRTEMPALARFARAHPEVRLLGIAVSDKPSDSTAFAKKVGVGYDLAVDRDGTLFAKFGGTGLPTTYVLDSRGRVARTVSGPLDEKDLDALTAGVS